MAGNGTHGDTIRLETRLTLMAEMLQRAAEEARQLAEDVATQMRTEDGPPSQGIESGEHNHVG